MEKENLVYFELNNWFAGRDYPKGEPFETWVDDTNQDSPLFDDAWAKENELVILAGNYDMSLNWCIIAKEEWVKENCPQLLSDEGYDYTVLCHGADGTKEITNHVSYSKFVRHPDEDGDVYGRFGWEFPEYTKENYGVHYHEDDYEYEEDDDEDEEEE